MKKLFTMFVIAVMGTALFAAPQIPQTIQDQIREEIEEQGTFYQEDEIMWSPHEVSVFKTDVSKSGETTTYNIAYEVGIGNEYDESVVYSIQCKAEVSETSGTWSKPNVECENPDQLGVTGEG